MIQHTGDTGIDLADGTQNSAITGDWITDTSASGVDVGEVDDYYQDLTSLMTLDDTISENTITHVGQDYHDDVGVWAGYTRGMVLSNNDIGYSPYGGISVGWGWGWESPCSMQQAQGLSTCRHGTNYAGDNQILDNDIHNIMLYTFDNGAIYTNGGQGGGNGSLASVISGNVGAEALHSDNMLYPDEGSSYWDITDNVIRFGGSNWIGLGTPTINNITVDDNYSDNASENDHGTDTTFTQATIVSDGAWPAAAQAIIAAAGPVSSTSPSPAADRRRRPGHQYTGDWYASSCAASETLTTACTPPGSNGDERVVHLHRDRHLGHQ